MGVVQLNQIKTKIDDGVGKLVDVSDAKSGQEDDLRLSRGLAAFAVMQLLDLDEKTAAATITDGYGDNGIDAVYVDFENSRVYLVQSKWSKSGTGSPALGDMQKFLKGFADLINAEFDRFNERLRAKQNDLENALADPNVQFVLVFAHSGQEVLSEPAEDAIENALKDVNDPIETASFTMLSQAELHAFLVQSVHGKAPDLTVTLQDWGSTQEPYAAYYGQVEASEVAEWFKKHNVRLFAKNLRQFLGKGSDVNDSLIETLVNEPGRFWYFNNGITVLCEKVAKSPKGGTTKKAGHFEFRGVSIVNGAQTVGCIGQAVQDHPDAVADARVTARFISLEDCPPDFAGEVTRATNTQNRVERRDFVALDAEQGRLATELAIDKKRYAIKSGEKPPPPESGCTVVEATVSLACAHPDVDLAVQAKREIGRLWIGADSDSGTQYHKLFNPSLTGDRLWRSVQILRAIDKTLEEERAKRSGREKQIGVHGNRLISYLVFQSLPPDALTDPNADLEQSLALVPSLAVEKYKRVTEVVEEIYPANYLASLFKNAGRCKDLVSKA
jgi:hypothetical protein